MRAQPRFGHAHWMLLALFFALTPPALLAQEENAPQDQTAPSGDQTEAVPSQSGPAQTDAALEEAEEASARVNSDVQGEDPASQVQEDAQGQDEAKAGEDAQDDPEEAEPQEDQGPQVISGMSILGNQEAPTSLVIVPWKSSELGEAVGISTMLDDSKEPVDREVFMRELRFYEIRSGTNP